MKDLKRSLLALVLAVCMLVGLAPIPASADSYKTYAQDTVEGSVILHCFDWSYNNIKAKLPEIAAAGYTAVQTSPVQQPKDYSASWTDGVNQWWKLYQPLGLTIAADGTTWLGTEAELRSLCTEAHKYGIKVIVDIVANQLANSGSAGGGYANLNSGVASDLKNTAYYHSYTNAANDDSRFNLTQYHVGAPDLNTGSSFIQQKVLELLKACIDCGVDGFRFDGAKHIELPTDDSSFQSDFWPTVLNGAKEYADDQWLDEPFFYGEVLGSAGPNFSISNYTAYMAVTDNETGDRALEAAYWSDADALADDSYLKGAAAGKSVLWVESHDTYMGSSGSAGFSNTSDVPSDVLNKAWAIVGARADSTALFFARPNSTMGAASSDTNWKSDEVAAVNKFKNHFEGQSEYLSSSGSVAYIERGTKGVVISKLDGGGSVSLTAHQMAPGTYEDQVSGKVFTVENHIISGTVGSTGVAVVYDPAADPISYITEPTLYLKPNSNWTQASARFAMYVHNSISGAEAWVSMSAVSGNGGYYSAAVPSGSWTNVIFVRMNPSSDENRWDADDGEEHVWNQTDELFPDGGTNCYTVASGAWSNGDGAWSTYIAPAPTPAPTPAATSTPEAPVETYTVYAIDNAGWNANTMKVFWWGGNTGCPSDYPGIPMTSVSGTKVYKYQIPKDVDGLLFSNGSTYNVKMTVDITSGIQDGAAFTISTKKDGAKNLADVFYLVGTMNSWVNNNSYAFSYDSNDNGKLTYKLSGKQLAAGAELKVKSSSGDWYPGGNNYAVSAAGVYDIYFRPNGDGDTDWFSGGDSGNYIKLVNVTPCTVTWKNGDTTLGTDSFTYGSAPIYSGETPTKAPTASTVYSFSGWKKAGDDTLYTADTLPPMTGDVTYTAQFTESVRTYTVTWKNYDGTELETDSVPYGEAPSYDGETPTRPNNGATIYLFSGWSPQITAQTTITEDTTYTARFSAVTPTYTIRWFDGDGKLLKTESCLQGVTPQYFGETPTKTADAQYTYSFNNTWEPAVAAADRDTDYHAQFDSAATRFSVTTAGGTTTYFSDFSAAESAWVDGSTLTLYDDVSANLTVPSGTYILDLNGHKISAQTSGNSVIVVEGSLTVTDGSTDKTGKITGGNVEGYGGGVYVDGGALTLEGGAITGNVAGEKGGGVYVDGGALTLEGGEITGNAVGDSGGGVYVDGGGTLKLTGGAITGNDAGDGGGGVYVGVNGAFTLEGGAVTGNTANSGGGVYVDGGALTLEGGAITGNDAESGGGVYVGGEGELTLEGGEITGNEAYSGGGVYVGYGGALTVSGSAQIRDNTQDSSASAGNVYIRNTSTKISVTGALASDAYIGVFKSGAVAEGSAYTLTEDDAARFHYDDSDPNTPTYLARLDTVNNSVQLKRCYALSVSPTEHGTVGVQPPVAYAVQGDTLTLSVTADPGYALAGLAVTDSSGKAVEVDASNNSFTMPYSAVTVSAVFSLNEPRIGQNALELNGVLILKYYLELPDGFDGTGAAMTFSMPKRDVQTVAYSDSTLEGSYRVFPCEVYGYQMADTITATFTYTKGGETKTLTDSYSVKEYLDHVGGGQTTSALVEATRNYGHYVQPYLSRLENGTYQTVMPKSATTDVNINTATTGSRTEADKHQKNTQIDSNLVSRVRFRLNVNTGTDLVFELVPTADLSGDVVVEIRDGSSLVESYAVSPENGVYRVAKHGIAANNLEVPYTFTVTQGSTTVFQTTASPMDYISTVLTKSTKDDEKTALAALYDYWLAAEAYGG